MKPTVAPTSARIPSSLSPTKVRVACECPRLFYLNHHFGTKTLFIPKDLPTGVGKRFHTLADEFIAMAKREAQFSQWLGASNLDARAIAQQMQQHFYTHYFFQYLQQNSAVAAPLMQVWQGLGGLIQRFAELLVVNRGVYGADTVVDKTFPELPRRLTHEFSLPNGATQSVTGEFDCVVFDGQRLSVVEFKTYASVDPTAQLAQVALYSYLLWALQKEPVDAAVYAVLPTFQASHYPWEELEASIHQLIPHKLQQMQQWLQWEPSQPGSPPATLQPDHLCPICPAQARCQTFFCGEKTPATPAPLNETQLKTPIKPPPVPSTNKPSTDKPSTDKPSTDKPIDVEAIGQDLVTTLRSFKVDTTYQGAAIGPAFIRVKLKPAPGVKVAAFLKLADDLRVQMGLDYPPLIAPQSGFVSVDLPRGDRQTAHFASYIESKQQPAIDPVKIAIGVDLNSQLVEADLSDPNTCHFLVGGTTGSGKSEFLRSLLLSLLVRHGPETLKIALVDPKRVTFPEFENMPWLFSPVVKQSEDAIDLMEQLVIEMNSRYRRFEQSTCSDLLTYNRQAQQPLPRIVCIFDEYADFMAEKEVAKALELSIKRLGAMARAAGIHLIIATQRPEATVVTPLIRSNLPGRIALRTASEADSEIVLGGKETTAAALLGKGDLLYKAGGSSLRLQSLFAGEIHLPRVEAV
jgi:DNA segregation ATPase FtsK/SpoIIIE, S-DNA-T family